MDENRMLETQVENFDLRKEEGRYATNPFIDALKGRMYLQPRANTIIAKGEAIYNAETGEVIKDTVLMGRRKIVDKTQFSKLYQAGVKVMLDMTKPAMNVYVYLMGRMDFENKAYINAEKDCEEVGYRSSVSVIKGIKELIAKGVIAAHIIPGMYWINPYYVCKGERFAMYTEVVTDEFVQREKQEIAKKRLKEQGQEWYESMDSHTQLQLEAMNKTEQEKYELNQMKVNASLFKTEDENNPFDE